MFNWFTKWFDGKCEDAWNRAKMRQREEAERISDMGGLKIKSAEPDIDGEGRMSFDLTPAVGGYILTVSRRERINHTAGLNVIGGGWAKTTYIISTTDNLGDRVAKILNLELIK